MKDDGDTTTKTPPPPAGVAGALPLASGERRTSAEPDIRNVFPEGRHDLRIMQALRRIVRSVAIHSRKLAQEYGITSPQLVCLMKCVERGPLSIKGLAAEIHLSPSTIVGIVDRLEAKGWVRRERCTGDRRLVQIHATDAGRAMVEAAPSPMQDSLARALKGLNDLERAAIALSLERLVDLMEIGQLDASPILEAEPVLASAEDTSGARPPDF